MRQGQLRQTRARRNERFEIRGEGIRWARTDNVGIFLRRIDGIDRHATGTFPGSLSKCKRDWSLPPRRLILRVFWLGRLWSAMRIFVILDYEKGSLTRGTFDFVDVRDDGVYDLTTPSGERHQLLLVDFHFELLYEIGSNALLDGYYREAVTSFAVALERFYETFIQFYFAVRNPDAFDWDAFWKNLGKQSERQLGAFCVAYCSLFGDSIPLL